MRRHGLTGIFFVPFSCTTIIESGAGCYRRTPVKIIKNPDNPVSCLHVIANNGNGRLHNVITNEKKEGKVIDYEIHEWKKRTILFDNWIETNFINL